MEFKKNESKAGIKIFTIGKPIPLHEFSSAMDKLASALDGTIEWINMPEAEIAKVKNNNGEIYAKLDFEYGVELSYGGLAENEISTIEMIFSSF